MEEKYFINSFFDLEVASFFSSIDHGDGIYYPIIKIMSFIYGDIDIYNPFLTKSKNVFIMNLSKFGMPKKDVLSFVENLDKFSIDKSVGGLIKSYLTEMLEYKKNYFVISNDDMHWFRGMLNSIDGLNEFGNDVKRKTSLYIDHSECKDKNNRTKRTRKRIIEFVIPSNVIESSSGNISILIVLITIAIVLFGIAIINIIVG